MRINPDVRDCAAAPIVEAWSWVRDTESDGLIDVCQAVPAGLPSLELREHLAETIVRGGASAYTDIEGLPALRETLAAEIGTVYGGGVHGNDVIVTAGCNQAFCAAIDTLCASGDEVILPLPCYFNHRMWLTIRGINTHYAPFDPQTGEPDLDEVRALVTQRTRAIVLVTPNNPTGAIYSADCIEQFYQLAEACGIALIVDETYRDFVPGGEAPHSLFKHSNWRSHFVHLYSFSKAYSLTGYRVGAVVAGRELLDPLSKVQDCTVICASHIGQLAALYGIEHLQAWKRDVATTLVARAAALRKAFDNPALDYELLSAGAYFAYIRHPFDTPAREVAKNLAQASEIVSLPGSYFGEGQENYLRFAFSNLGEERFDELISRLIDSQA